MLICIQCIKLSKNKATDEQKEKKNTYKEHLLQYNEKERNINNISTHTKISSTHTINGNYTRKFYWQFVYSLK